MTQTTAAKDKTVVRTNSRQEKVPESSKQPCAKSSSRTGGSGLGPPGPHKYEERERHFRQGHQGPAPLGVKLPASATRTTPVVQKREYRKVISFHDNIVCHFSVIYALNNLKEPSLRHRDGNEVFPGLFSSINYSELQKVIKTNLRCWIKSYLLFLVNLRCNIYYIFIAF